MAGVGCAPTGRGVVAEETVLEWHARFCKNQRERLRTRWVTVEKRIVERRYGDWERDVPKGGKKPSLDQIEARWR